MADLTARLAAEAAIAVLKVAFGRWIHGPGEQTLRQLLAECVDALGAAVAGEAV